MRQVSEPLQNCTDHPKGFPYPFERRKFEFEWPTKGQIISKGLFGILGFFQKTNEEIISKCPFGVIVWTKIPTKIFENFCPRI